MLLIKCEGQRYFLACKKKFTNPHFSWGTTGGCTLLKQFQVLGFRKEGITLGKAKGSSKMTLV